MDFTVKHSIFTNAVTEINKIISSKNIIPILTGIKMDVNEDRLKITGSNSDIIVERTIPLLIDEEKVVEVRELGSCIVLSKYLTSISKKLTDDISVKMEKNNSIIIKSGDIETKLRGLSVNEYPKLPEMDCGNRVEISFGKLKDAIKQTVFAVSKNETRPVLTGVKMEFTRNKLICTATDSHRLAYKEVTINCGIQEDFIVPRISLSELMNLKEIDTTVIDIYYIDNFIAFKTENSALYSRLLEGRFPNTLSLVPSDSISTITMNTLKLIEGIDRACVFSNEWKQNNVQLEIVDDKTIKISSKFKEVGMIEEHQRIIHIEGENDIQIVFDGQFVLDALKGIKEKNVTLSYYGSMKPIVIKPENNSSCLHLISPLRSY